MHDNGKFKEQQQVTNAEIKTELVWHRYLILALMGLAIAKLFMP
jgi:hypothetical protein